MSCPGLGNLVHITYENLSENFVLVVYVGCKQPAFPVVDSLMGACTEAFANLSRKLAQRLLNYEFAHVKGNSLYN